MNGELEQWEKVGVNQPALVEKILSDYSGPFDVFRELIQNADDANAERVEIHFLTESSDKHDDASLGANVRKWAIRDNGDGLVDEDQWKRLCVIANGNEDPEKVGTFGVGFYTVLGVCDQPLLKSKGQSLRMKKSQGDGLHVKRELCETDGWTSVELVLKDGLKERLPNLPDLARFLVSSITFLEKVNSIAVFLTGQEVLCIQKNLESGPPLEVTPGDPGIMSIKSIDFATQFVSVYAIGKMFLTEPKTRPNKKTAEKIFALSQVAVQAAISQLNETEMKWKSEVAYCLYTAQIEARPSSEMEEGVKSIVKSLPRGFLCKAVYLNAEQQKAVEKSPMRHLFDGLDGVVPRNNSGRIFIGQSTKEPTGIDLHIASKHIVPDVVRSSVRLGNSQVDKWNELLLNTAGRLARAIYEQEMKTASKLEPAKAKLEELGLYTMQRFAFDRRPTSGTSLRLKSGFFSAPKQSVLSNSGILDVSLIRRYDKELYSVLEDIPYLHAGIPLEQRELIEEQWDIPNVDLSDMVEEFASGRLSEAGMEKFFSWLEDATRREDFQSDERTIKYFFKEIRNKGRLYCDERKIIELKGIERYTQLIHHRDLLPSTTIYVQQAQSYVRYLDLLGWKLLEPINWMRSVCKSNQVDSSKAFDSRILTALAGPNGIPAASSQSWKQVADHLALFECISTNHGLKKPGDSYLKIAGIWNDIPVAYVDRILTDQVYERLGVRSRLEWDGLLDRLEASADYTNDRVLPYLADMIAKKDITDQQIRDLGKRKVFDSETHGRLAATALHQSDKLGDTLRELGLPLLGLRGADGISTDILNKLGVRVYPPLEVIDGWLATSDDAKRNFAIQCLAENSTGYREEAKKSEVALIPTKGGTLAHPHEVFSCSNWEELGFHVVSTSLTEYAADLGLEKDPGPESLIKCLKETIPGMEKAQRWFKQLSQCINVFNVKQLEELKEVPFIPYEIYSARPHLRPATPRRPKDCFVMSSLPAHKPHLSHLLPFIEFGDSGDNLLATYIAKTGPPKASDIAWEMVACPQGFLQLASVDGYQRDLRDIAKEIDSFCEELREVMRTSPILLGRRIQDGSYELRHGCEILIGGDEENLLDFCQSIFVVPDGLKTLYEKLGSKPLDNCVTYNVYPIGVATELSSSLKPEDILQCVNALKAGESEQEWQFDISSRTLLVKTCQKLELEKRLDHLHGVPPVFREVAAGLKEDSDDSVTLWIVEDHKNMYTDIATALCRKLLKTYSRRDVLTMKLLLLMDKESRVIHGVGTTATTVISNTAREIPEGPRHMSNANISLPSPYPPVVVTSLPHRHIWRWKWKWSAEESKGHSVAPKLDPIELAKQAISLTPRKTGLSQDSQKLFKDSMTGLKKDIRCKQVDTVTDLEVDERFKKYDIMFLRAKKSGYPERLGEAAEKFAKLVIALAGVFKIDPYGTFCIFWKDVDCNLMAFYCRSQSRIYLNLAHYYEHHHTKGADEKRVVMDWYLIFAHELAHYKSFHHDALHEQTFAGLCISHLDALRRCFPYQPPLGSI